MRSLGVLVVLGTMVLGGAASLGAEDACDRLYLLKRKEVDEDVARGFLQCAKTFEQKKAGERAKSLASHVVVVGSTLQVQDAQRILARLGPNPSKGQDTDTEDLVDRALDKYRKLYLELIAFCEKKKLPAEVEDARKHLTACFACRGIGRPGEDGLVTNFEGMTEDDKKALDRVNLHRKAVGLQPVSIDATLCKGCRAHCNYLDVNRGKPEVEGLKAHEEVATLPGYTPEGARAGKASDIAWGLGPARAVDHWVGSLYHRTPLLDPDLRAIGFGFQKNVTCLDLSAKREKPTGGVVVCPADGAKDIPRDFDHEIPDPIPEGAPRPTGYPITITGYREKPYKDGEATFEVKVEPDPKAQGEQKKTEWKTLPIHFSSPAKPARADRPDNCQSLCILPRDALLPRTTYRATFRYTDAAGPQKRVITFTTGE